MQLPARLGIVFAGIVLALCTTTAGLAQQAYQPAPGRTLLRAGHVLDVHTGKEAAAQTIIVEGDHIVAIAPTASTPAQPGDREIALTAATILPGLLDGHTPP